MAVGGFFFLDAGIEVMVFALHALEHAAQHHVGLVAKTLRIAVGPMGSTDLRVTVAFLQALQRERSPIRLKSMFWLLLPLSKILQTTLCCLLSSFLQQLQLLRPHPLPPASLLPPRLPPRLPPSVSENSAALSWRAVPRRQTGLPL